MPNRKILVVDDERLLLNLLESALSYAGFLVTTANSGEEAIDKLSREQFAFLLTDLEMGKISGVELTRKALTLHDDITVFMLSGCYDDSAISAAYQAGVTSFLHKPVRLAQLLNTLAVWAKSKKVPTAETSPRGTGCQYPLRHGNAPFTT